MDTLWFIKNVENKPMVTIFIVVTKVVYIGLHYMVWHIPYACTK